MTYDEKHQAVRKALYDRQIQKVAIATGLSRGTLYNIRNGVGTKPFNSTLNLLANHLGLEH